MVFGPDGHLYVCSGDQSTVLRYNGRSGAFIDVFVSPGSGGLYQPDGLAFGPDGNLYVGSRETDSILRFHGRTGDFMDGFIPAETGWLDGPTFLLFLPGAALQPEPTGFQQLFYYSQYWGRQEPEITAPLSKATFIRLDRNGDNAVDHLDLLDFMREWRRRP